MTWYTAEHDHLRRIFVSGFLVSDIAEPLVSYDGAMPAMEVAAAMRQRAFELVGVRQDGLVAGYLRREELGAGACSEFMRSFDRELVISASTPLAEAVLRLCDTPRLFVSLLGSVGAIVSRSDLQKPPVRMWLFGMITIIEMRFAGMIQRWLPNESWRDSLSAGRLAKAEALLDERRRRNQELTLLDCLQFSDKGNIIARNAEIRQRTQFQSRRKMEEIVKELEALRNNLAHSQDIIINNWNIIVQLTENLNRVLRDAEQD